ncbi:MAG: peptide deformylase [Candidatus Omnitrophica bacterium]|nr:peptide deformylase [Candidatus Omnitrophota bacterium]
MSKLRVTIYGEEILRKKARFVKNYDKRLKKLIDDMFQTMYAENGIGLAAPQVNVQRKVIVIDTQQEGEKFALVNPKILWKSEETETMNEGCLSIPGVEGDVVRAKSIRFKYNHPDTGEEKEMEASDLLARVVQHETDHLNGVLFIDHLSEKDRVSQSRILDELAVV